MDVLAIIHGEKALPGVFGDEVADRGHTLEAWSPAWAAPTAKPVDDYGAVMVFGGAMHADQDDHHPWLREENFLLQRLFALRTPLLGVCLGAQLIAKAAHAEVYPASQAEIGWYTVELTEAAADDPIFSSLPERFEAFQWHYYTHGLPGGAEELARSALCTQAFRLGDRAWGIQFHAEVTENQIREWANEPEREVRIARDELVRQTGERIAEWNALGRSLCDAFVEIAERVAVPA
jgi:GMP synthase (glutamine-hydrolysing)